MTTQETRESLVAIEGDEITLRGKIPVSVVVNLATGNVQRVLAHDTAFEYEPESTPDTKSTSPEAVILAEAYEIAESVLWPSWEFSD